MKRKLFAKRLISCILSVCMLMCLFAQAIGVSAETDTGNPVSMGGVSFATEWLIEPVKTDVEIGVSTTVALNKTAFTIKSKVSGEYLTAAFADDGSVTLSTLPRDEANDAQLWVFLDTWVDTIYYYGLGNLGKYILHTNDISYPARINRSGSSFTYSRLAMSGEGYYTIHFNGSDNNSLESLQGEDGSFSATISFRDGTSYYFTEDYKVVTPSYEVSANKSLTNTLYSTKWFIEPVKTDVEYNITNTFKEGAHNHVAYTIRSTASGSYLTASYDENGAITLSTATRDEENDGQLWIIYDHWMTGQRFNIFNLGYYYEVDGVSYPAQLIESGTEIITQAAQGIGTGGYGWLLNDVMTNSTFVNDITKSITATIRMEHPTWYITEKCIGDTSLDAAEKKTVYNAELDYAACGAQSLKFTPAKYVTYYNDKGTAAESIAYLISSQESGAYLTANYAEDGTVTMTFDTRDTSNDSQLWILRENWAAVDTNWYGLINLGSAHTVEIDGEQITALYQLYYSSDSTLVTGAIGDKGEGDKTWMLNGGGTADSDGHLAIGVEDIVAADGSFKASLALRSPVVYVSEDTAKVDTANNVKIAASSGNELFDASTVDKNAAYRWHIQYNSTHNDVKYYTVKNVLTGTYLTMYKNGIYLAERDADNSHQLWAFIDGTAVDSTWNSVYLMRCLGHNAAEINTWSGNSTLLDENGLAYFNTAVKLNAGGLAWALLKNRGKVDISDDMTVVLNSYQWGKGGNYYLCSEQAVYGDINGDTSVDIRDLVGMKKQSAGIDAESAKSDMDADGINAQSSDLSALRKILIGA